MKRTSFLSGTRLPLNADTALYLKFAIQWLTLAQGSEFNSTRREKTSKGPKL